MLIKLNIKIYPVEAILSASYAFIDTCYIFLDYDEKNKNIAVSITGKKKLSQKELDVLRGLFLNELLYSTLRYNVSKKNRKLREYIIGRALYTSLPEDEASLKEEQDLDYRKDPLGIAVPWEKKHKKKTCKK